MNVDAYELSSKLSKIHEWRKWAMEIPEIQFPSDWRVRIIPPFSCAIVRFRVRLPEASENDDISVYLDCYDDLGSYGEPYWEVYPYRSDVGRCSINDVEELLRMISDRW